MRDYVTKAEGKALARKHADILNKYPDANSTPQDVIDALAEEACKAVDDAETSYWYWFERMVKP